MIEGLWDTDEYLWEVYAVPNIWEDSFSLVQVVGVLRAQGDLIIRQLDWLGSEVPDISDLSPFPAALDHPFVLRFRAEIPLPEEWWLVGVTRQVDRDPGDFMGRSGRRSDLGFVPVEHRWPPGEQVNLEISGPDHDVASVLAAAKRPFSLTWLDHGQTEIDVSSCQLHTLTVSCDRSLERIVIPAWLRSLVLVGQGDWPPPHVVHELDGLGVGLNLKDSGSVHPVSGMERAYGIAVTTSGGDLDLTGAGFYTDVQRVSLYLGGGGCDTLGSLSEWTGLRRLLVRGMHRFDPSSFPKPDSWPEIEEILVFNFPKDLAPATRKRLKGKEHNLRISGTFDPLFIGNPLNRWVERNPKLGKKAFKEFVKARKIAEEGDVEAGIKGFVKFVNSIESTFPIETDERNEAHEVADLIGKEFGATEEQISEWFDQDRDF